MRHHRFYTDPAEHELTHDFWLRDGRIVPQWLKVLRYREGDEVVLFDGLQTERLYRIAKIDGEAVHLQAITDFERKLPAQHVYLFWSLLKKDKNDWVVQKCTELGVRNFVPLIAERSEKTGFNLERAQKIAIEASEQCGRGDIPDIRDPITLEELFREYSAAVQLLACDEQAEAGVPAPKVSGEGEPLPRGILIGPEGGWSDGELEQFKQVGVGGLHLGNLTLRAETAAVTAAGKLLHHI